MHEENDPRRVAAYRASSAADGAGIGWSLSGPDSGAFSIDGGVLRFAIDDGVSRFPVPPDYESPSDADAGNDYEVTVEASHGGVTVTRSVTVTVTDVDEAGTVTLSTTRPRLGVALTAALSDPDGVSGQAAWRWERSVGRNAWTVIAAATASTYTPAAADTGTFLRATASYRDEHGAAGAVALTSEVVTGSLLSGLEVTTSDSSANPSRALMPAFSADVLHYAVGCGRNGDTMTVTAAAAPGVRLAVDGVQVAGGAATPVTVHAESDVHITLTGAGGASTTYVVHCLIEPLWVVEATKSPDAAGILEDLMLLRLDFQTVAMLDNNGVPRFHRRLGHKVWAYFRVERGPGAGQPGQDREYRYSYFTEIDDTTDYVVLDQDLQQIDTARTVAPLETMDPHDFRVLENGNYLLMAYEPAERDFGGLSFDHPDLEAVQPQATRDSAVQIVTPEGEAVFTWSSWGNMPLEDCAQHRFPDDYAHINSLQMVDGLIIGSFRGCSRVLAIDPDHPEEHRVAWRAGRTNLTAEQWVARNVGPAPMVVVGDPAGEFCGQHAVQVLPNGNLLMFDNGVACLINPWTGEEEGRAGGVYSRAVEYALDPANGEAVFVRDHSLHNARSYLGAVHGQVEPLANGDWLISWGNAPGATPSPRTRRTSRSPRSIRIPAKRSSRCGAATTPGFTSAPFRLHPVALFEEPGPLAAELPASVTTSLFSFGTADAPRVVVAFSRPVVDFAAATPSVSVEGATVTSVSAHVVAGEPANAYVFTLVPSDSGAITFSLVEDQPCASGGICTADGTALTAVPAPLVIGPPVTVGFGAATYLTIEGDFVFVSVRLNAAHHGVREVTVPVVVDAGSTAAADEFSQPPSVTFAAGEREQTFTILVTPDALDEGAETVRLALGDLPPGVTAGTNATTTVNISDGDVADIRFSADRGEVSEGGEVRLTFDIANDVTFQRTEAINLAIAGTATPGVDFTMVDEGGQTLSAPYAIAFPPGVFSVTATIHVTDDADAEPDEDISIGASFARRGEPLGTSEIVVAASDAPAACVAASAPDSYSSPSSSTRGWRAASRSSLPARRAGTSWPSSPRTMASTCPTSSGRPTS